jgi:hypothetical protein
MPLPRFLQRCGRPTRVSQAPPGRREAQPRLAHIMLCDDLCEQRFRPAIVMPKACSGQRKCHGHVAWRQPPRAIKPPKRRCGVTRGRRRLADMECF